ncbi:hypothetical protein [Bradyrhizobium sp. RD5-C2]|uniref:hypothetical protein n=1 Tax=Bradyrhizobium sp. RD5-C2 TaxID=244562 RepID=UPI001CC76C63|nr:hypothetical protein [Bradyrhizobium sp. RD5-C2]GIQ75507.1 hypothetical protein BraRD5C2_39480 [Bradyrhizobium sp. RD5-C2]
MLDQTQAWLWAHHSNIERYLRLLSSPLSDLGRAFIARRLNEESASLEALSQEAFPIAPSVPKAFSRNGHHV